MAAESADTVGPKSAGGKGRVLIVDDDPDILTAFQLALERQGYEVIVAHDGNEGLAMFERDQPDLVILDMMMPKRSGFLVLERLRLTQRVPVRVIMVTGNEGKKHKDYAESLGVDAYLPKGPALSIERLLENVERLLA